MPHTYIHTNTWFQQKKTAQHTWTSPGGKTKNQIDYILCDKRFRNGIRNSKSMPGADCGSDHNPVVATLQIKLKGVKKSKHAAKWNTEKLKDCKLRNVYQTELDMQLRDKKISELDDIEEIWDKLKESITDVADEICGRKETQMKQKWMNSSILAKMEERRKYKNMDTVEGRAKYKELKHCGQKLCREAKNKYFDDNVKKLTS